METITSLAGMEAASRELRRGGRTIAVVPTMGYLHAGHASLIEHARPLADIVVVTVFVNPVQFGPREDYARYPRDLEKDCALARAAGADMVFHPSAEEMYPAGYETYVSLENVSQTFEGRFRPVHFRGVATVVEKLFNIVQPHLGLFGQKDAQQVFVIRKMVRDLNKNIRIVVVPIVRESDGLALSSRNVYLTPDERQRALVLYRSLFHAQQRLTGGERSIELVKREMLQIVESGTPTQIDYIEAIDPETFTSIAAVETDRVLFALAVRFGSTRLIDNILITL